MPSLHVPGIFVVTQCQVGHVSRANWQTVNYRRLTPSSITFFRKHPESRNWDWGTEQRRTVSDANEQTEGMATVAWWFVQLDDMWCLTLASGPLEFGSRWWLVKMMLPSHAHRLRVLWSLSYLVSTVELRKTALCTMSKAIGLSSPSPLQLPLPIFRHPHVSGKEHPASKEVGNGKKCLQSYHLDAPKGTGVPLISFDSFPSICLLRRWSNSAQIPKQTISSCDNVTMFGPDDRLGHDLMLGIEGKGTLKPSPTRRLRWVFSPKDEKSICFFSATIAIGSSNSQWMWLAASATHTLRLPLGHVQSLAIEHVFWPSAQLHGRKNIYLRTKKILFRSLVPNYLLHLLVTSETHRRICISSFGSCTEDSLTVGYARLPSSISGVYFVS